MFGKTKKEAGKGPFLNTQILLYKFKRLNTFHLSLEPLPTAWFLMDAQFFVNNGTWSTICAATTAADETKSMKEAENVPSYCVVVVSGTCEQLELLKMSTYKFDQMALFLFWMFATIQICWIEIFVGSCNTIF